MATVAVPHIDLAVDALYGFLRWLDENPQLFAADAAREVIRLVQERFETPYEQQMGAELIWTAWKVRNGYVNPELN